MKKAVIIGIALMVALGLVFCGLFFAYWSPSIDGDWDIPLFKVMDSHDLCIRFETGVVQRVFRADSGAVEFRTVAHYNRTGFGRYAIAGSSSPRYEITVRGRMLWISSLRGNERYSGSRRWNGFTD